MRKHELSEKVKQEPMGDFKPLRTGDPMRYLKQESNVGEEFFADKDDAELTSTSQVKQELYEKRKQVTLKMVKQELVQEGKKESNQELMLTRSSEDEMSDLKQEIVTTNEFFDDKENNTFMVSNKCKLKDIDFNEVLQFESYEDECHHTNSQPMLYWVKPELIEERIHESVKGIKQEPADVVTQESVDVVKHESNDELMLTRSSEDEMSELKQEIVTTDEFFEDNKENNMLMPTTNQFKLKDIDFNEVLQMESDWEETHHTISPPMLYAVKLEQEPIEGVKQDLFEAVKHQPIEELFLTRSGEHLMSELKPEIVTTDEFFANKDVDEFLTSTSIQVGLSKLIGTCKLGTKKESFSVNASDSTFPLRDSPLTLMGKSDKLDSTERSSICKSNVNAYDCTRPKCEMSFCSKISLNRHISSCHKKLKQFKCYICKSSFSQKAALLIHVMSVHKKSKPFKCRNCDSAFNTRSVLIKHIQSCHKIKESFKCFECNSEFSQEEQLSVHTKSIHEKLTPLKCTYCDYSSYFKDAFSNHLKSVHRNLKFKCSECNYEFSQKANLFTHIKEVHLCKQFKCSYCEFVCTKSYQLARHVKSVHKQLRLFKCKECNSDLSGKRKRPHHIKAVHEKSKKIKSDCKEIKSVHKKIERDQVKTESFVCHSCNWSFSQKVHFSQHIKLVHNTSKSFKCLRCEYACSCNSILYKHITTVHLKWKPFKCSACDFASSGVGDLKRHIRSNHKSKL